MDLSCCLHFRKSRSSPQTHPGPGRDFVPSTLRFRVSLSTPSPVALARKEWRASRALSVRPRGKHQLACGRTGRTTLETRRIVRVPRRACRPVAQRFRGAGPLRRLRRLFATLGILNSSLTLCSLWFLTLWFGMWHALQLDKVSSCTSSLLNQASFLSNSRGIEIDWASAWKDDCC